MSVADQLGPRPFLTMRPRFASATELVLYVMSNCGHRPAGQPTAIHRGHRVVADSREDSRQQATTGGTGLCLGS